MKSDTRSIRVGVVGVGTMGRHHVRIVSEIPGVTLSGLYEPDTARAAEFCDRYGCQSFPQLDELLDKSDAVSVAAPTSVHVEIGEKCLKRGLHTLMEKPLADSVAGAERLVSTARSSGAILSVGHVERHNPAIDAMMKLLAAQREEIITIDTRRLAPFDGTRCLDVDVLSDLLIHDIDLALEIADSPIAHVSGSARKVFSHQNDVVYARMEFRNGTTAVLWAGKCSPKKVRTITVATPQRYFEADTLVGKLCVHTAETLPEMEEGVCFMGEMKSEDISVPQEEPLRREIEDFVRAIRTGGRPVVDGKRALDALEALDLVARAVRSKKTVRA